MAQVNQQTQLPIQNFPEGQEKKLENWIKAGSAGEEIKFPKKILIIGIISAVIIGVVAVFQTNFLSLFKPFEKSDEVKDVLLVSVEEKDIYTSDVEEEALKQYSETAINKEILQSALDRLIERTILEREAQKNNIIVTYEQAYEKAKSNLKDQNVQVSENFVRLAQYDLYKQKIMNQFINSRTAFTVSYWTPSSTFPEATEEDRQLAKKRQEQAVSALPEIEKFIKNGEEPLDATRKVMENSFYSDLKQIIAVNGYILEKTEEEVVLRTPKVYTDNDKTNLGDKFYSALFSLQAQDIKLVFGEENARGMIMKVVEAKNAQFTRYEDWLAEQKKVVEIHHIL